MSNRTTYIFKSWVFRFIRDYYVKIFKRQRKMKQNFSTNQIAMFIAYHLLNTTTDRTYCSAKKQLQSCVFKMKRHRFIFGKSY